MKTRQEIFNILNEGFSAGEIQINNEAYKVSYNRIAIIIENCFKEVDREVNRFEQSLEGDIKDRLSLEAKFKKAIKSKIISTRKGYRID